VVQPDSPMLSVSQLATLAELGEERTADVGEVLYGVGAQSYPFIAILEGEVAILDPAGHEIVRHGPSRFLGELNFLSGQTVFVSAVVATPLRYIAVERDVMRKQLFEDGPLSDLVLSTFIARREALQTVDGLGVEIAGPRSSAPTMRMLDFVRRNRLPFSWRDEPVDGAAPVVRLPGGTELRAPSVGDVSRALGIGRVLERREEVDLVVVGAGPAGLGAAVYGASEGLDTLVVEAVALGGQASTSSRIENYLGFPAGISGSELAARAAIQAEKFGARVVVPGEAVALEREHGHHVVHLAGGGRAAGRTLIVATGAHYRRLDVPDLERYEGLGVYYAATQVEARLCENDPVLIVGGGNSAGQAAIFLAEHAADCKVMIRGADLGKSMSRYLVDQIERDERLEVVTNACIVALQGDGGLESVTVEDVRTGQRHEQPCRAVFVFIGAEPHTDWLRGKVAMDTKGFVFTGRDVDGDDLAEYNGERPFFLETSRPGVFAVGDAHAGSIKRVASAVGEGSMAVRLVHQRLE
jgi:thioredoxin reductase (NADPH)